MSCNCDKKHLSSAERREGGLIITQYSCEACGAGWTDQKPDNEAHAKAQAEKAQSKETPPNPVGKLEKDQANRPKQPTSPTVPGDIEKKKD